MARAARTLSLFTLALSLAATSAFAQPRTAAEKIKDDWITTKIEARYFLDTHLKANAIAVSTQRGLVTLIGVVPDRATRNEAIALARRTDGVTDVVDLISIAGPPAETGTTHAVALGVSAADERLLNSDAVIRSRIELQLALDTSIPPSAIHVAVDHGDVTLRGEAGPLARELAVEIAQDVGGVRHVHDKITLR
jgi:osmotically-inducible protein OsmY